MDLSHVFSDSDQDPLTYTATSAISAVATVNVIGNVLTIHPTNAGTTMITVTANDGNGGSITDTFEVIVENNNQAPVATDVRISGTAQTGETLAGSFTYFDNEGDGEGTHIYKWYRAAQSDGSDKEIITGAASNSYTLGAEDAGKYIFFEVTPVAQSGEAMGMPQVSQATNKVTASVLINEGFNNGTAMPEGFTSNLVGTFSSSGNYGLAAPSLKFGLTNDYIQTPILTRPATELSFWLKNQASSVNSLNIKGYNGSEWVEVANITDFSVTGIRTFKISDFTLPVNLIQFKFTFNKPGTGNIAFDDLVIK